MRDVSAMNDAAAAESGFEIELAREKPFRLADTLVRPASLELEFQSQTITVEPRVMQVLVALSREGGDPTSRRRLMGSCWGRRLVTDGALNRSIAQLRKALRDPGIQIGTIPRVGYRLRVASASEPLELPPVPAAGVSTECPESADGLPPAADAPGNPVPIRAAAAGGAFRSAISGRAAQLAVAVAIALLALTVVAWSFSLLSRETYAQSASRR